MPSVVHHKGIVCLQGGQLGGEDINRERKEDWEVGSRKSGKAQTIWEYMAAFNFMCFTTLSYTRSTESALKQPLSLK